MAKARTVSSPSTRTKSRPALTPEAREQQLVARAYDLVEQRLIDGTASSQETTHFLKIGSSRYQEEMEKLRSENEVLKAKAKAIEEERRHQIDYEIVIKALRTYSGSGEAEDYEDYDTYEGYDDYDY